jgi:hypothetical protein
MNPMVMNYGWFVVITLAFLLILLPSNNVIAQFTCPSCHPLPPPPPPGSGNTLTGTGGGNATTIKPTPTISISSSQNPSVYGQQVTFTAQVSTTTGITIPDLETVTFTDGTTQLGIGLLSKGQATFFTSSLSVGQHTITASYPGDNNFAGSSSQTSITVNSASDFTLSASPSSVSIQQGSSGTSAITVNPSNGFSQSVSFSFSSTASGVTGTIPPTSGSQSTLSISVPSTTPTGTYTITVTGTSGSLSHTTSISLTVPPITCPSGQTLQNRVCVSQGNRNQSIVIPSWIHTTAQWWHDGKVGDKDFLLGVQWMIQNGTMKIPPITHNSNSHKAIPYWIRTNAGWWADGQLDDETFVNGIQWLISDGDIAIHPS